MKPSPDLLTPDDHALVIIDLQDQMAFAVESISRSLLRTNSAIVAGASRIFNVPTIVTTANEMSFAGPVFPEIEEYYPKASAGYYDRTTMNTWEDESAYNAILATQKKKLVLIGLWTSVCIVDTGLSALAEGFDIYFIADACGDVTTEAHERAIQRLIAKGGIPMTSVQYLLELQRDWARSETYVAVTDLIKKSAGSYGLGIQYAHKMLQH